MAEFIARKKAAEAEEKEGKDDKDKRREEIMKRVAERRKQREQEGSTGSGASGLAKLTEDMKAKDAAHQKEVFEFRKTIDDLHSQITKLNSDLRTANQIQSSLDDEKKKTEQLENEIASFKSQMNEKDSNIENLKNQHETEISSLQNEISTLKSEKVEFSSTIENLQQQVDSLVEIKNSENSLDEKITQLSDEITDKNNEINLLKKDIEKLTLENNNLKSSLEQQSSSHNEELKQLKNQKCDLDEQLFLIEKEKNEMVEQVKELTAVVDDLHHINKDLQEEIDYQRSVVEAQEQQILEGAQLPASDNETSIDKNVDSSSKEDKKPESLTNHSNDSFEIRLLNEINLLRKNPDAYADNLVDLVECYNGLEFKYPGSDKTFTTKEGVNALEDAIEYLQTCQKSFPPLTLVDGLCKSANYLCEQNGPTGSLSTTCADGFVKITIYFINLYLFLIELNHLID